MSRIPAEAAAVMFEEIIGWPYQSPGVTDDRGKALGIDCSGAWVRVYRAYGLAIDHGSNSQFRRFCARTGVITGSGDLHVGMAVFKLRVWKDNQRGHRDYGTAPGDIYHVGCVTGVSPLRIVHATTPAAKADTKLGNWTHWGLLREVESEKWKGKGEPDPSPSIFYPPPPASLPGLAKVITTTSGLRLRKLPGKGGAVVKEMPIGAIVQVLCVEDMWAKVRYTDEHGTPHQGWCCIEEGGTKYLRFG